MGGLARVCVSHLSLFDRVLCVCVRAMCMCDEYVCARAVCGVCVCARARCSQPVGLTPLLTPFVPPIPSPWFPVSLPFPFPSSIFSPALLNQVHSGRPRHTGPRGSLLWRRHHRAQRRRGLPRRQRGVAVQHACGRDTECDPVRAPGSVGARPRLHLQRGRGHVAALRDTSVECAE